MYFIMYFITKTTKFIIIKTKSLNRNFNMSHHGERINRQDNDISIMLRIECISCCALNFSLIRSLISN